MITLTVVVVVTLLLFAGIVGGIWYGTSGEPNSGPALGTNNPYPPSTGLLGGEEPPYLPTPVISEQEQFRNQADRKVSRLMKRRQRIS